MQHVGQIIHQRREALGLTLAQLADAVGATKGYLSMIENARVANPPSQRLLDRLETALRISDGELCRAAHWQSTPPEVRARVEALEDAAQRGRALARWLALSTAPRRNGGKNLDKLHRSGQLRKRIEEALGEPVTASGNGHGHAVAPIRFRVPLINRVAAGYPTGFTDLDYPARIADRYVPAPDIDDPDAFALVVCGDSMLPAYHEGDIVFFSPVAKVEDGCDCCVRLEPDHETTFKRVYFDEDAGTVRLQPLNPKFAPQTMAREQVAGLYRAVGRFSKV